jgi:H+/Cl- antiporter ClcA
MDTTKIIELLSYTLPAIVTGLVAYYFFDLHTKNEEGRRRYLLNKQAQTHVIVHGAHQSN